MEGPHVHIRSTRSVKALLDTPPILHPAPQARLLPSPLKSFSRESTMLGPVERHFLHGRLMCALGVSHVAEIFISGPLQSGPHSQGDLQ